MRSPEVTREAVLSQLITATHAAAEKPLKEAITTSGVKDSLAMPTLNFLIAKGKTLRRATDMRKALSPEDVNRDLCAELLQKKDDTLVNPLLTMDGEDFEMHHIVQAYHVESSRRLIY